MNKLPTREPENLALRKRFHHLPVVLMAGAFGGGLAYLGGIAGVVLSAPLWNDNQFVHLLLHICFGSLTAGVFVYLVANTDRDDSIRMFFLAALVGVFWNPTLLAAKALLDARSAQKEEVATVKQEARTIVQAITSNGSTQTVSKPEFAKFLDQYSSVLNETYIPAYKAELQEDPGVKTLFKEASEQPWFDTDLPALSAKYPNIDIKRLSEPR